MSNTPALVFPGQGSQHVGMLSSFAKPYPIIKKTYDEASSVLGYDLWKVISEGPEETLNRTEVTQPALLAAGVALWRLLEDEVTLIRPAYMAGHSLGEYTALVCANAISFEDAVRLVEQRGKLMQDAVPLGEGAMAAIVGLDNKVIKEVCDEIEPINSVSPANFNAPGQVVVAGTLAAVELACERFKEKGARMAKMLAVSVPSHSPLMRPAAEKLEALLADIKIEMPTVPVLHNVNAAAANSVEQIRKNLVAQLYSPVKWVDTVRFIANEGIIVMLEMGPGRVLSGLNKRIDKDVTTLPMFDVDALNKALARDWD